MADQGIVAGGWQYVIAAYSLTAIGLLVFAWSLFWRFRQLRSEDKSNDQ